MALEYPDQFQNTGTVTVANPAAAVTITLGWQPRYIRAINVNNLASYEWFEGMADGTSIDTANHDSAQISVNAAGSITVSATGFTLGLDICDTAADVVRWLALR
jgi:hypothetical protein